jgi:hypothetical protein
MGQLRGVDTNCSARPTPEKVRTHETWKKFPWPTRRQAVTVDNKKVEVEKGNSLLHPITLQDLETDNQSFYSAKGNRAAPRKKLGAVRQSWGPIRRKIHM